MGPGIACFQSNQKNRILLNGMMKVVGPVETGDSKALPDLSRMLHKNRRVQIPMTPGASQTSPRFPQAVGKAVLMGMKRPGEGLAAGVKSGVKLVVGFVPWFILALSTGLPRRPAKPCAGLFTKGFHAAPASSPAL
jgi:hypothetical protein